MIKTKKMKVIFESLKISFWTLIQAYTVKKIWEEMMENTCMAKMTWKQKLMNR